MACPHYFRIVINIKCHNDTEIHYGTMKWLKLLLQEYSAGVGGSFWSRLLCLEEKASFSLRFT